MRLNEIVKKENKLSFSKKVKDFFGQSEHCTYIPMCICNNHKHIVISYQSIKGKSATDIPERFEEDEALSEEIFTIPFNNKNTEDKKASKKAITKIAEFFTYRQTNSIKKYFMINGATIPLQIGLGTKNNPFKQVIYVKQPDNSRLLGYELYNIINGKENLKYCFNEKVFVEEGIQATPASSVEPLYITIPEYKERFARAAAQAELLGVQEDSIKDTNRLVDNNFDTILFDFNIILEEPQGKRHNFLLTQYTTNLKGFMNKEVARAYQDEKRKIAKRLNNKISYIAKLSNIMGNQQFFDYENPQQPQITTLNKKIEKYYGQPDLLSYIHQRVHEFSK